MDKNAIKKFAVWARKELIDRVSQKAKYYGITEDEIEGENADSVHGVLLSPVEKKQRRALISEIKKNSYQQVIEAVAYTWFNRFSALRFMEVNGYLPTRVRVFTDANNDFNPQILTEALHLDLDGLDQERVIALKQANQTEELYKYLLITQCNALNAVLPGMFQKIEDYTELLLPDHLLRAGSVIEQMVACIPEKDWDIHAIDEEGHEQGQVQIIGWLYQYYNIEPKKSAFDGLNKNIKITRNELPAATQLFTPDWIVRYMVENSLGREVVTDLKYGGWASDETEKINQLKAGWKYYLEDAEQSEEVNTELHIYEHHKYGKGNRMPFVDTTFMDPCMGSGHILVAAFDVYMDIYTAQGWTQRDAARRIVEKNLFGLDIDERAAQLAYFAVMMKALQYDRRFLSRHIQPNVFAIPESNGINAAVTDYFVNNDTALAKSLKGVLEGMRDAKLYGSILTIPQLDFQALYARVDEVFDDISNIHREEVLNEVWLLIKVADILSRQYTVVATNPPYMAVSNAEARLQNYIKKNYPDSKTDLFAVFIERCGQMTKPYGYQAMITQHAWMFLSSFEKLREKLQSKTIINMAHLGARAFEEIGGEVVQTTSFVLRNCHVLDYTGIYCRLVAPTSQRGKEEMFLARENQYCARQFIFFSIPGAPIAYWVSSNLLALFNSNKTFRSVGKSLQGTVTGDNDRFMRLWYEVNYLSLKLDASNSKETMGYKWIPYSKGGEFRRWYGNIIHVIDWENDGFRIRNFKDLNGKLRSRPQNIGYFFREAITWSSLTTGKFGARLMSKGCSFSDIGPIITLEHSQYLFRVLGYVNSKVFQSVLDICCTGLHYQNGVIAGLPCLIPEKHYKEIDYDVESSITISKSDWDSYEISWDFQEHPFKTSARWAARNGEYITVQQAFEQWKNITQGRFQLLKKNEEEINRILIDICGLQDELTPEVEDKDVTVRRADLGRDIRSLISYAVGCMFGRYSLDEPGLVYAGGEFDYWRYHSFTPVKTNIIPICDDDYFETDILSQFINWLNALFGEENLEDNLKFIAGALGGKGTPRQVIRNYFLNDFYADHLKIYQKRPIYWLFDSGKKNGFKALIYMHRYQPYTLAQLRTDYVHEQQARYRTAIESIQTRLKDASTGERVRLNKQLTKLQAQADEIYTYEQKVHHLADQMISIDLDDGVKHNYAIFQDVLAKIK